MSTVFVKLSLRDHYLYCRFVEMGARQTGQNEVPEDAGSNQNNPGCCLRMEAAAQQSSAKNPGCSAHLVAEARAEEESQSCHCITGESLFLSPPVGTGGGCGHWLVVLLATGTIEPYIGQIHKCQCGKMNLKVSLLCGHWRRLWALICGSGGQWHNWWPNAQSHYSKMNLKPLSDLVTWSSAHVVGFTWTLLCFLTSGLWLLLYTFEYNIKR